MGKQDWDVNDYLQELLKDVPNPPKEEVEAAKRLLTHEKVAPRVKDLNLMRSDYSRNMDAMRAEQERIKAEEAQLQQRLSETEQFYQSQILADHNNAAAFQAMKEENERLRRAFSTGQDVMGDGTMNTAQDPQKWVSRDEYLKQMKERDEQTLNIIAKSTFLAAKHQQEFGEPLDVNEWYKHSLSKGIPLDVGYDSYTAGLREKKAQERHQKELEEARELGRQEALSKANFPLVDNRPRGIHAIRDAGDDVPKTHNDRVAAAVGAYLRGDSSTK